MRSSMLFRQNLSFMSADELQRFEKQKMMQFGISHTPNGFVLRKGGIPGPRSNQPAEHYCHSTVAND